MKIDLFNVKEFIDINHLQEVTSPILFQRGDIPHPNGLISNEIFGITTKSRKETFAYIRLYGHFFHPHIFKVIRRLYRNIDKVVNGEMYVSIDPKTHALVTDENGETGIDFIYENWDKIKWEYSENTGMRNERIDLILKTPKDKIFTAYLIVIPAFYRDITISSGGGGETDNLNKMYSKLIRLSTLVRDRDMFDFQFHSTNYNIQLTLIDIYNYFKTKLEKKNGLLRKYLMGRNVDYCTRSVITAPTFHANKASEMIVDFAHAAIPISQACSLCYPFIMKWVKDFFDREVIANINSKIIYDPVSDKVVDSVELLNPESYFTEKYFKKRIDAFIKDPESRFDKIEIPVKGNKKMYLRFTGKRLDPTTKAEISGLAFRPMTWTDVLYMAAEEVTRDKHCLVTRYPLLDEFGIFIAGLRVSSTTETEVISFNGKVYPNYPKIDFTVPLDKIAAKFIDSLQFSNSMLPGLDGDYDGDQVTVKIIFTIEANEECRRVMNSKSFFINAAGKNIRFLENEAVQTYYTLTKAPTPNSKKLNELDKKHFVEMKPSEITFEKLIEWFGDTVDVTEKHITKKQNSKFNPTDYFTLTEREYPLVKGSIETTLGRLIMTKLIVEDNNLGPILGYINYVLDDGGVGRMEGAVTDALKDDKITVSQMYKYIDTRDWIGMQLHGVITTSFTQKTLHVPKEVKALKKELLKKYAVQLANNDPRAAEEVDKQLIAKAKEVTAGDIGMDLYISGARGSIGNNYKNMFLSRGAVKNNMTGKYDVITNSLLDGLEKKDIATHSNVILAGAYPKAVGTQVSGYLAKELLSALQSEVLGDKDSDCGTKGYIEIEIPKKTSDFTYRYIIENGKLKCLTPDIIKDYIGKTVKLRSPMFCTGVGHAKCLCNKCAGDFYYKLGKKNIGLVSSRVATTCTRLNMKKFHENLIKTRQIDVDSMLI